MRIPPNLRIAGPSLFFNEVATRDVPPRGGSGAGDSDFHELVERSNE